jgi:SAM-dependent MidA family methyltransferase
MSRPARSSARVASARGAGRHQPLLSFCDFVDQALFHSGWGYYGTGSVRFGTGGHYDTYPLALSPLFGEMVAHYAFGLWRRAGKPTTFEICELGAGNGQLCLDTLLWVHERGRHERTWKAFSSALRYRIVERSPALVTRQRQQLGPLGEWVIWSRTDLSRRLRRGVPFGRRGVIVANEVLDCLPHHKLVAGADAPGVAFVESTLAGRALDRSELAAAMEDPGQRSRVRFREVVRPLRSGGELARFTQRHHPELFTHDAPRSAVFVCPAVATLLHNAARLYDHADALWIDYGELRGFHRRAPENKRVFAGVPRSGAHVLDNPGRDDITFLVDFSAAMSAARDGGWRVAYYGPQVELARRTQVALDAGAVERIVHHRALRWMLALAGVGPERAWQRSAVTWTRTRTPSRVPVQRYVEQSVREFQSERTHFKLLITRR